MAKGDKYIGLTKYLQGSGSDTVELTFSQIGDIVGGLPPAYRPERIGRFEVGAL